MQITPQIIPVKLIQKLIYYVLPVVLLLVSVVVGGEVFGKFGTLAMLGVTAVLYVQPLSILTKNPWIIKLFTMRREMGVASFWLFFFHAYGLIFSRNISPEFIFNVKGFIFWGFLAGMGMWLLGLTSNNFSQKLLKKNWKRLQRVVYPTYFLLLYHASMAEGEMWKFWVFGGGYVVLKGLSFYKRKRV